MIKRLINKIRRDGWSDAIYVIWREIVVFYLRWIPFPLRITYYIHLFRLLLFPNMKFNGKRILGIWDYSCMPIAIGDLLLFVQALSVVKLQYNAEAVDIAIIYDKDRPCKTRLSNLNNENAQDYFIEFLPLFSTSPYLGSIFQFNDRNEFNDFFNKNVARYITYPSLNRYLGETFNYGKGDYEIKVLLDDFYKNNKHMPKLRIGERDMMWAYDFFMKNLPANKVPVVLSLKNTFHSQHRNADPAIWLPFIKRCEHEYPEVMFIQIGLRGEEFCAIRKCKNVIIAKDFCSSLLEDFALMRASVLYLGTTSGVTKVAEYSDLPFLIFRMEAHIMKRLRLRNGEGHVFSTKQQKFYDSNFKMSPEILFNEFEKVYQQIDLNNWRKNALTRGSFKHSHPSTQLKG